MIKSSNDSATISPAKNIFKVTRQTGKFSQIPNDLVRLATMGSHKIPARAYQTLCYILSLPPETVVTPAKIADRWNRDAFHCGGKTRKRDTISRDLAMLEKAGYAKRIFPRDETGKYRAARYYIFASPELATEILPELEGLSGPPGGKKIPPDKVTPNIPEKEPDICQESIGIKIPAAYNKERVSYSNTENTNSVSKKHCVSVTPKNTTSSRMDFFAAVPPEFRDKKIWVLINSLIKYFGFEAFDFMTSVFASETIHPDKQIPYLWGAINKRKEEKTIALEPGSLNKSSSDQNPPDNPQKNMAYKEQEKYNQELKAYSDQDMFMQKGERQEQKKELGPAARRIMERMKKMAHNFKDINEC